MPGCTAGHVRDGWWASWCLPRWGAGTWYCVNWKGDWSLGGAWLGNLAVAELESNIAGLMSGVLGMVLGELVLAELVFGMA